MKQTLLQSLILILSFIFVFIFVRAPFSGYTVPLIGVLVISYLILGARNKAKGLLTMGGGPWGIFALNSLIFLIILETGGLSSNLFPLLYFLGFAIAFIFKPHSVVIYIIGSVFIFYPEIFSGDTSTNIIKLLLLVLISPLAYFFSATFRKEEKDEESLESMKERAKDSANVIANDVEKVLKDQKQNLKEESAEKLNEILEETETLRQERTEKE